MKLRVWWVPQAPMKSFKVDVATVAEGVKIMQVLADYDAFQFENNIKPDYCNVGGLQMFDQLDDTDAPCGSWIDWYDEESGEDDPVAYLDAQAKLSSVNGVSPNALPGSCLGGEGEQWAT